MHHADIPFEAQELARAVSHLIQLTLHGVIEDITHKATLSTAAHTRHTGHNA